MEIGRNKKRFFSQSNPKGKERGFDFQSVGKKMKTIIRSHCLFLNFFYFSHSFGHAIDIHSLWLCHEIFVNLLPRKQRERKRERIIDEPRPKHSLYYIIIIR